MKYNNLSIALHEYYLGRISCVLPWSRLMFNMKPMKVVEL